VTRLGNVRPMTGVSFEHSDSSLPFGTGADDYDRLRFFPPAEAVSWLLRGDERHVLDLAAGTGQATGQLIPLGLTVVAVEPDPRMRAVFAARFPRNECLDGTAERIPLPDDSLDAVIVGSAWHWFDAPAALTEIARVLHDRGRLGVFATSVDTGVDWVRDMFTEVSLRAQQRGDDSARNVTLPSAAFPGVEETVFDTSQAMDAADVVAWFRTHSTYLKADEKTKMAMEDRAARVLHEVFPGERTVEVPVMTLCWRTERLPR
jgi:SAM-dependent methyltransferase